VFLPKGFYRISRTINMTARALVLHHDNFCFTSLDNLIVNNNFSLSDRNRPQLECTNAHVRRTPRHGHDTSSDAALPRAPTRFSAHAAVHVHDVDCDVGAFG
jgi:hypothetical protein